MDEYQKQAEDFCKKYGVVIHITRTGERIGFPNDDGGDTNKHFTFNVRIWRKNNPKLKMSTTFTGSAYDYCHNERITKYDVLADLSHYIYQPNCIEDFMLEYGYEIKKRGDYARIKRIFDACQSLSERLHKIFNKKVLEDLAEIC